jgi:hypothetical protein
MKSEMQESSREKVSAIAAAYAGFKYLTAQNDKERAHYDWMGYIGNFIKTARKPRPFKAGDEWPPGAKRRHSGEAGQLRLETAGFSPR